MRELRPNRWLPRFRKSNRKPRDVAISALGGLAAPTAKSTDSTLRDKAAVYVKPAQRINSDRLTLTITNDSIPQQPHQPSSNRFHRVFKLRDVKKVLRNKRVSAPTDQFRNPSPPSPPATNPDNTIELRPPPPPSPHKIRFNRRHRSAMPANIIDPPSPPTLPAHQTVDQFFDDVQKEKPKFFCAVEEKKRESDEMLDDDDDFYQVPCPAPSRRVADVSLENLPKHHSRPTRAPPNSIRFSRRNRAPAPPINSDQPYVNRFYSEGHRDVENEQSISLSFSGFLDRSRPSSTSRRKILEPPKTGDGVESRTWQLSAGELRFNSLNVKYAKRKRDNPMRPLTVSDASSVQPNLRASLSAPVSAMKESGGNSFWFAERPKPRSRLRSAFQFRLGSRLESHEEPPPPIASVLEIPWTAPGGVDEDDLSSDSSDSQSRDIANSFLSFPLFNMLARGPAVGNNHSSRTSPPKSPSSSSVAMRLLRRPFTGRSFPVPAAARAKAKAAEQALEEFVAEKAMRPSDASISLPTPSELELDPANSPDDPHEFDVDEYSSLHSAIAAMLSERAKSRGRDGFMEVSNSKVRDQRHSENDGQKPGESTRFQSTGAPVSREIANGCAFSGTVLSFTMDPSKSSIQVPPAPLVYGPESTAWRNVLSEFSDPQTSNPELHPDDPKNEELTTVFESEPYERDDTDEMMSYRRVSSTFERMGSFDFDKPSRMDGDLRLSEANTAERDMKEMTDAKEAEVPVIIRHLAVNAGDSQDGSAPQPVPQLVHRYKESLQPRVRHEYEEEQQRSVLLDHSAIPPTLADVQKLAAETRRISARRERHNGLLEMWQHRVLADLSRASESSPMRFAGVRSEATTFTTFSETSKEFDRASMASSDDLYVAAPSTLRTDVIGSRHSELASTAEIVDRHEPGPPEVGAGRGAAVERRPEVLEFGAEVR